MATGLIVFVGKQMCKHTQSSIIVLDFLQ